MKVCLSGLIIILTFASVCGAITLDNHNAGSSRTSHATETLASFTTANQANRFFIGFTTANSSATVSSATYNGVGLTNNSGASITSCGTNAKGEIWYGAGLTATTADFVSTITFDSFMANHAIALYGVQQTSTFRDQKTEQGCSNETATGNLTMTTQSGDFVLSCVYVRRAGGADVGTLTPNSGTKLEDVDSGGGGNLRSSCSYQTATGSSLTVGWTWTAGTEWIHVAMSLIDDGTGGGGGGGGGGGPTGTIYYVSKAGLDSHACSTTDSAGTNRLTITAGAGCLAAGDTLVVHAGTYTECVNDVLPSGTDDSHHTTLIAATGETVIINGACADGWVFEVNNRNFVTVDGLIIDASSVMYAPLRVGTRNGSSGDAGSTYFVFQNGELRNAQFYDCVTFQTNQSNNVANHHFTIRNNKIHNCATPGPTTDGLQRHCVYVGALRDSLFDHNEIYNCGTGTSFTSNAVQQYREPCSDCADRNTYVGNIIHDATAAGLLLGSATDTLAYNNVIYTTGTLTGVGGIRCRGDTTNCRVFNNTIYSTTGPCITWAAGANAPIARNNICRANSNNIIADDGATNPTQTNNFCSSGCASSADPLFVNESAHNFHLSVVTSPAVNAGAVLNGTFTVDKDGLTRGTQWDVGAYEFLNAPPPTITLKNIFKSPVFISPVFTSPAIHER